MKTKRCFPCFALIPAIAGMTLPTVMAQDPAPDHAPKPKMEIEVNGKKVEMDQIRAMAEGFLGSAKVDENTRQMLRKQLDQLAPQAKGADGQAPHGQPDVRVNGHKVDMNQLRGMAEQFLGSAQVDDNTRRMLRQKLDQMAPLANLVDGQSMPKIEVYVNGQKVEMDQIRGMAKNFLDSMNVDDNTCQMLRQHLNEFRGRMHAGHPKHADKQAPDAPAKPKADAAPPTPGPRDSWKIGIVCEPLEDVLRAHLPIPQDTGMVVSAVMKDSPAAKAGLKKNDVIVAVGEHPLKAYPQLVEAVANCGRTNQPLTLKVLQQGKENVVVIKPDAPVQKEAAPEHRGRPDMAAMPEQARMMADIRGRMERQQKEMNELRKQLATQAKELRKLREMIKEDDEEDDD